MGGRMTNTTAYEFDGTRHVLVPVPEYWKFFTLATDPNRYFEDMGDGRYTEYVKPSGSGLTLYVSDPRVG